MIKFLLLIAGCGTGVFVSEYFFFSLGSMSLNLFSGSSSVNKYSPSSDTLPAKCPELVLISFKDLGRPGFNVS